MAFDVVKKITDTEKEGEEIVKKAQSEASEILKKSKNEAESIIDSAEQKADEYYKNTISKYELEAREASEPIIQASQGLRNKLANVPTELMNSAVNMVIERIVNSHGNS
ncbi:MAG: ATPase [Clostridiales bacterium]|nr:ATPase [Clostridiales bacterium]